MVKSKPWDWAKESGNVVWLEPSQDSYYLLYRWTDKGFNRVLDLGCGLGRHSLLFAENGYKVDSFDLSQNALDRINVMIKDKGLDITTTLGDMLELPYEDQCFDGILAYHSIGHTDSEGIKKVISEIARVLRPRGEVLLTLLSKDQAAFNESSGLRIDNNTVMPTTGFEEGIPHYYIAYDEIPPLLNDFEIISIRGLQYFNKDGSSVHFYIHAKKL
jgi:ubiquinone/menaquinone biosynthesis C-methylase UbiE